MTRITSIETYNQIKEEGLLSDLRFKVYDILYEHQPITISQMLIHATRFVKNTGSYATRISELERLGMIYEHHKGSCPITGRNVIFWATTDSLPVDYEKPLTRKEKKDEILNELRILFEKTKYKSLVNRIGLLVKEI